MSLNTWSPTGWTVWEGLGGMTVVEEVCHWDRALVFQKTCAIPSHKLTHTVHMYTHIEKMFGCMYGYDIFEGFSRLVDPSKNGKSLVNFKIKHLHGTDGKDLMVLLIT